MVDNLRNNLKDLIINAIGNDDITRSSIMFVNKVIAQTIIEMSSGEFITDAFGKYTKLYVTASNDELKLKDYVFKYIINHSTSMLDSNILKRVISEVYKEDNTNYFMTTIKIYYKYDDNLICTPIYSFSSKTPETMVYLKLKSIAEDKTKVLCNTINSYEFKKLSSSNERLKVLSRKSPDVVKYICSAVDDYCDRNGSYNTLYNSIYKIICSQYWSCDTIYK